MLHQTESSDFSRCFLCPVLVAFLSLFLRWGMVRCGFHLKQLDSFSLWCDGFRSLVKRQCWGGRVVGLVVEGGWRVWRVVCLMTKGSFVLDIWIDAICLVVRGGLGWENVFFRFCFNMLAFENVDFGDPEGFWVTVSRKRVALELQRNEVGVISCRGFPIFGCLRMD